MTFHVVAHGSVPVIQVRQLLVVPCLTVEDSDAHGRFIACQLVGDRNTTQPVAERIAELLNDHGLVDLEGFLGSRDERRPSEPNTGSDHP